MTRKFGFPTSLRQSLVLVWNAAHHATRLARDYANSIVSGRFERCTVCGRRRLMLFHPGIIPRRLVELWGISAAQAIAFARKESCFCAYCGANLRARRLAQAVLALYPTGSPPAPARSLAEWVASPEACALRVAEINRVEGMHQQLTRLPDLFSSDYHPRAQPGSIVDGIRSEDLTRLTYPDASFDLVLTSETLEHVPDLTAALSEIRRVLAPGGRHIFTIPLSPSVAKSFARSIIRADGSIEHHAQPICHPGGDTGYPVFTEFGADLGDVFVRAGFEFEVFFGPNRDEDVAQVYVTRKPATG